MSLQLFPVLDPSVDAALTASIERFGVLVPVTISGGPWQMGELLDGHHRRRIAKRLGRECPLRHVPCRSEEEALEIARTLNMDRRQLTPDQRQEVVTDLRGRGFSLRSIAGAVGTSQTQVARDLGTAGVTGVTPAEVLGQDGKHYPARRPAREIQPGDVVSDGIEERQVLAVEVEDDETVVLHDNDGEAFVVPPDHEVEITGRQVLRKTEFAGGVSHPARFSTDLVPLLAGFLEEGWAVLDPFAGTGRIHELRNFIHVDTVGVEIEPEWAELSEWTVAGDALDLPFEDHVFDAIVTSPTYGNRLADHHEAYDPESRRTYRHDLGRALSAHNSGQLQWGERYRDFHVQAWKEAVRVLRPGGRFVLNIKDHIRDGRRQPVSAWHASTLLGLGLELVDCVPFVTTGLRNGANHLARLDAELVWVFEDPSR